MKQPRKSKEPIKASNIFKCLTCEDQPEFDGVDTLKEHMKTTHTITELKGSRKMMMHLDCQDSFSSSYELEIGGVKLAQFCTNPRHKSDPMRFA